MKILVDENIPLVGKTFARHGEVQTYKGRELKPDELIGADALITRSVTKVNKELLAQSQLKFVGTCTIGIDHFDVEYLEQYNIPWASAPGCNAQSVVDYVLSVLALLKRLEFDGVKQPKVGIIGCGNVGNLLRKRFLKMDFPVSVYDPFLNKSDIAELTNLEEVLQADIVCLHTPYSFNGLYPTKDMIGRKLLDLLPPNACLISAGRGGVLIESDLLDFMNDRPDVQVALDVWKSEPRINEYLLNKVQVATPHIAGYALEGKCRGTLMIYQQFCKALGLDVLANTELASQLKKERLNVEDGEAISSLILSVYNPMNDTFRMRESWMKASAIERTKGTWFDELRRQYPERRELASVHLEGDISKLSPSLSCSHSLSCLEKIGFRHKN